MTKYSMSNKLLMLHFLPMYVMSLRPATNKCARVCMWGGRQLTNTIDRLSLPQQGHHDLWKPLLFTFQ